MKIRNKKKHNQDYSRVINTVLLFLFILLLPTQLGKHFFFDFSYLSGIRVDYLAPTLYITDLIVLILTVVNIKALLKKIMSRWVLVVFLLLLINVGFAQSPLFSLYRFAKIIELIFVVLLFRIILPSPKMLVTALFTGSVIELTLSLLQLIYKHSIQGMFYFLGERYFTLSHPGVAKTTIQGIEFLRPYGSFSHPNSMAGFYLVIYFLLLTHPKFKWKHSIYHLTLFISSLLVFLSFSKLAIITYIFLNAFLIIRRITQQKCKFCLISRFLVLIIVGAMFLSSANDPLSLQKRVELVRSSFVIIAQHPWLGTGIGNYLLVQENISQKFNGLLHQPVHNIFLLWLAETGLVGIGIALIILNKNRALIIRGAYVISALVLTGSLDHYWLSLQQNFLLMGLLWGVL